VITWSTPEQPEPERQEPERLGVIDFMVVILFPGLVPDGEFVTDPPGTQVGSRRVDPDHPGNRASGPPDPQAAP
jgi:hypothetical protein